MPYAIIAHDAPKIKKMKSDNYDVDGSYDYYRIDCERLSNKKMIDKYRKALSKIQFEEMEVPPYKRHHFDFLINNDYLPDQMLTVFLW